MAFDLASRCSIQLSYYRKNYRVVGKGVDPLTPAFSERCSTN